MAQCPMLDLGQDAGDHPGVTAVTAQVVQGFVGAAQVVPVQVGAVGLRVPGFQAALQVDELKYRWILVMLGLLFFPMILNADTQQLVTAIVVIGHHTAAGAEVDGDVPVLDVCHRVTRAHLGLTQRFRVFTKELPKALVRVAELGITEFRQSADVVIDVTVQGGQIRYGGFHDC
ncbi:hypothetical protein D3C77_434230 [compost metagenome]